LEHVDGQAEAAVLLGDVAREVAVLEQQLLPVQRLLARLLAAPSGLGRQMAVLGDEGPHLALQREVFLRIGQLHALLAPCRFLRWLRERCHADRAATRRRAAWLVGQFQFSDTSSICLNVKSAGVSRPYT